MIDFFNAYTYPCFALLDSKGRLYTLTPNFPGEQLLKQLRSLNPPDNTPKGNVKKAAKPQNSQYIRLLTRKFVH